MPTKTRPDATAFRVATPYARNAERSPKKRNLTRNAKRNAKGDASSKPSKTKSTRRSERNEARNAKRNEDDLKRSAAPAVRNALEPVPPYVPSKVFPVCAKRNASQAEQAQQIASDLLSPEAAAVRIIVSSEGTSATGECLDVPGALAELRRVSGAVNAGDLSHAEAMLMNQAQAMQTLSTRLIERGLGADMLPQFEAFMRLGLRAQAQSRLALETLAVLKQGPAVFARQAIVAHGPQQVNNGVASAAGHFRG